MTWASDGTVLHRLPFGPSSLFIRLALRWHIAGDIYSPGYAMKIIEVATRSPFCRMWLYTRSWRTPTIEPLLRAMAALPNLVVYYSCDLETGLPVVVPQGVRIAYMETVEADPPHDDRIDLLFRDYPLRKERVPLHMAEVVCPSETVEGKERGVTCATCARCFVK